MLALFDLFFLTKACFISGAHRLSCHRGTVSCTDWCPLRLCVNVDRLTLPLQDQGGGGVPLPLKYICAMSLRISYHVFTSCSPLFLPPTPPRDNPPSTLCPFLKNHYSRTYWTYSLCWTYSSGCGTIRWSVINLRGAILLNKTDPASFQSYRLPIIPHLGVELVSTFPLKLKH